jgi:hypothetical protein
MPLVSVHTHSDGRTRSFSGSPGCDWPGNQAIAVYFDAANHDVSSLSMSESELRCDEDPTLLAVPTPLESVVACRHGLWTAHAERLIRVAAGAPELAGLGAARLFPRDVGAMPCAIHSGGAFPGRRLAGVCGVRITSPWSTATVTFTEKWTNAPGKSARHIWRVTIRRNHVVGMSQSGAAPPQTWP